MSRPERADEWNEVGETTVSMPRFVDASALTALEQEEEQAPETERAPAPIVESQVRLVRPSALDASRFVEEAVERHVQLSVSLLHLEGLRLFTYDPSTRAAWDVLRRRVTDLGRVRDALKELVAAGTEQGALDFYFPDRPLATYVNATYGYAEAIAQALAVLATELRILQPDWRELRGRVATARSWRGVDFLLDEIRAELALHALRGGAHEALAASLGDRVRRVAFGVADLQASMEERFG